MTDRLFIVVGKFLPYRKAMFFKNLAGAIYQSVREVCATSGPSSLLSA